MSLFDDMADYQFEGYFPFGIPGEVWHSKYGNIPVREMTTRHIKNCMKIVGEDDEWYRVFQQELERRADNGE